MGTPDGNVTRGELLAAGHEASQRLGDLNAARLRYRRAQARLAGRRWQLGLLRCALWLRGLVVTYLGRWGGVIVLPIVASAVAVSLGAVLRATPGAIAMAAIASGVVTVIAALAVFGPQEQRLARRLVAAAQKLRQDRKALREARRSHEVAQVAYDEARATADAVHKQFYEPRAVLLRSPWERFRGVDFERFLEAIFQLNGYRVQHVGGPGDHGADLVMERNGRRIVVQAKGYPSSTVGNEAVREACFARDYVHHCQVAAVITNSTFTPKAKEAAQASGCVLIDRTMIPALIRGEIAL